MGLLDDLLTSKTDPVSAANADVLVSYETRIKNINALEDTIEDLSDDELRWGVTRGATTITDRSQSAVRVGLLVVLLFALRCCC